MSEFIVEFIVEHSPNRIPMSQSVSGIGKQVNHRRMFALATADTQTMMMSLPSNVIVRSRSACSANGSCCLLFPKQSQGIAVQPEFHKSTLLKNEQQ